MRHVRSWLALAALLVLTACGGPLLTSLDHEAVLEVSAITVSGAAFLPPIGRAVDTSNFFAGASVAVEIFAADAAGAPTGPLLTSYSTAAGTVSAKSDGFYMALWRVQSTVAANRQVSRVVVQVWATGLAGSGVDCTADRCLLGSFEAVIRRNRNTNFEGALDLTRSQTLPIKVHVAGPQGFWPTSIGDLRTVTTGLPFTVELDGDGQPIAENCIVNDFTVPGQGLNALGAGLNALGAGLNALGAVGGLFLLAPGETAGASEIRLAPPAEAGAFVDELTTPWSGTDNAALLVVDDFSTTNGLLYLVPPELRKPLPTFSVGDLENAVGTDLSHGALVLHQVLEMLEAEGSDWTLDESMSAGNGSFRVYYRFGAQENRQDLVIAAVDTGKFNTDMIAGRIQNALNTLLALESDGNVMDEFGFNLDVRRVIVNMSFAIVPCAILYDFEAFVNADPTFQSYVAALADANGLQSFRDELTQLIVQPLAGAADPIGAQVVGEYQQCDGDFEGYDEEEWWDESPSVWESYVMNPPYWLQCPDYGVSHDVVNYVASSGNFGLGFPMFPAAWPFVLGVSAQNAVEPSVLSPSEFDSEKAEFANDGEVMAPGALFELGRSSDIDDPTVVPDVVLAYAGTSFAAPVVLRLHAPGHPDRKPTWLELFYDLIYVAAIIQLGNLLAATPRRRARPGSSSCSWPCGGRGRA
jgi:hypothetical protein